MTGTELFNYYRQSLAIVFGTYAIVRLVSAVWKWQLATHRAGRREAVLRRYVVVSLLRTRLRRFWFELLQITLLIAVLVCLVRMQAW